MDKVIKKKYNAFLSQSEDIERVANIYNERIVRFCYNWLIKIGIIKSDDLKEADQLKTDEFIENINNVVSISLHMEACWLILSPSNSFFTYLILILLFVILVTVALLIPLARFSFSKSMISLSRLSKRK